MMAEETQEVPKWMKELEDKRERRLKARLGHEAGAGSPCLSCDEKCPGLDLHFWRKICKNCKCGKENHDVNDDDIYGWAQFQLLGSKPTKPKKIVLPGRKDAVELEWTPKGHTDVVESYLKDLPVNRLPIKGSAAAQERKQLLQKQIPLHDIDPTLCHALSEAEIKQMNDYVAHVKQNSVGVGHIMKLNELLKNRQSANAQFLSSRDPMQVPQVHSTVLQGAERTNPLAPKVRGLAELDKALQGLHMEERKPIDVPQDDYVPSDTIPYVRDVNYEVYYDNNLLASIKGPTTHFLKTKAGKNIELPQQPIPNQIDYQVSVNVGNVHNVTFPAYFDNRPPLYNENVHNQPQDSRLLDSQYPKAPIYNQIDHQNPTNPTGFAPGVYYPTNEQFPNPTYHPHHQPRSNFVGFQGIKYPSTAQMGSTAPQANHGQGCPQFSKSLLIDTENRPPVGLGRVRNVYPDMNVNYDLASALKQLDNDLDVRLGRKLPHYAAGLLTTYVDSQNPQQMANVKDLAYSTYNPNANLNRNYSDLSNENLQHDNGDKNLPTPTDQTLIASTNPSHPQRPANYNPTELTVSEQNLNPTSINVGIINDIEYPPIKTAIQKQNDLFATDQARKNVQFDPNPEEILPACHKCKKMFDSTAIVIGIDHTDALWHAECFKCSGCNQNLADLMYFYDKENDDVYCGRDYAKIRGIPRCQACDELIFVKEYCLAENSTFHVKHFCCFECDEPLAGQNYVMEDLQPLCLPCFETVKAEKCNACLQVIKPDEQGANLNGVHFHADDECFACKMCKKPLLGAKFLFKNSNLYCSTPCFGADK